MLSAVRIDDLQSALGIEQSLEVLQGQRLARSLAAYDGKMCGNTADLKADQFFDQMFRFIPHDRFARDVSEIKHGEVLDATTDISASILLPLQKALDIHLDA